MVRLSIDLNSQLAGSYCGLCGRDIESPAGPRLFLAENQALICHPCGKKHAPSLVALLDLARVAKRVGHMGRHTLVPPINALLDLARAAEDYTFSVSGTVKHAA
jgi:hypothetical protein